MKLELTNPRWTPVIQLQPGCQIVKGRRGVYWDVRNAAAKQRDRFGCYAWQTGGVIQYCGSFADDYEKEEFKTNLEGRVHNYWQNHRIHENGRINTNKHVFDQIVACCKQGPVGLLIFGFDDLYINETHFTYAQYAVNHDLVIAVEAFLICQYRVSGQCTWNRT